MIGGGKACSLFIDQGLLDGFILTEIHGTYSGDAFLDTGKIAHWSREVLAQYDHYTITYRTALWRGFRSPHLYFFTKRLMFRRAMKFCWITLNGDAPAANIRYAMYRRDCQSVEWGGLENRCAHAYRGFESLSLRHKGFPR